MTEQERPGAYAPGLDNTFTMKSLILAQDER